MDSSLTANASSKLLIGCLDPCDKCSRIQKLCEFRISRSSPLSRSDEWIIFRRVKNWKRKSRKNGRRKTTCKLRQGIQVHPIFIQKACLSLDWSYFGKVQIAVNKTFRQSCSNCVNLLFGCTFFQALCNCWPFLYCQDADQIGKVACLPTIILIAWEKRGGIIPFFAEWRKYLRIN